jgi:hypothetical protein
MLSDMEVPFTPEQEAELLRIALDAGTDPATLVREAALRLLARSGRAVTTGSTLPISHLGEVKSLHRRDLYDEIG